MPQSTTRPTHYTVPARDRPAESSEAGLNQHVFSAIVQPLVTLVLCGWEYAFDGGRIAGQLDERSFGQVDPNGTQASPRTPSVLGSTTKAITALAVMLLVEGGKVSLDDRVQRYLPWFRVADPRASAEMTVRQLLNQTSGLDSRSGWVSLADFDNTPDAAEKQARDLATLEFSRPVGSAFEFERKLQPARTDRRSRQHRNLQGLCAEPHLRSAGHAP